MSRYCLDTSAYSRFRLGEPAIRDLIREASWIGVPAVTIGELQIGFGGGKRRERNEEELAAFLAHPAAHIIELNRQVAAHYAAIFLELRQAGTLISDNDVWIAACAAHVGAPLLTYDGHFQHVRRAGVILLK